MRKNTRIHWHKCFECKDTFGCVCDLNEYLEVLCDSCYKMYELPIKQYSSKTNITKDTKKILEMKKRIRKNLAMQVVIGDYLKEQTSKKYEKLAMCTL